ncbi:NAD-dependent epimerase/dehydratase family protein [Candidatus Bathyarchaeota archaeon]|nr:NAD-dependent epimerase/dehydratase family protein [Candidatus Bathyarchaeota archaeon]
MNQSGEDGYWNDARVLITGANGFVGSWISKALISAGATVHGLLRDHIPRSIFSLHDLEKQVTCIHGELENYSLIKRILNEYEIEHVFHVGGQSIVGAAVKMPRKTITSNILGTTNILEACRQLDDQVKGIVIASSDKVYGTGESLPFTETDPLNAMYPYDVSKSGVDLLSQAYSKTYDMPITITRCANIYGGGDFNPSRLIPGVILAALKDKVPILRSDGNFIRDFIHVEDVTRIYLLLGERASDKGVQGEAFNFSYEVRKTVLEVVEKILNLLGRDHVSPKILNTARFEIRNQYLSCKKAREVLSWEPVLSFDEGLVATIEWYKSHLKLFGT